MEPPDFGYGDRHGVLPLRAALAEYLGRVRGVIANPAQIVITSGFEQGRSLVAKALQKMGITRMAVENPGYPPGFHERPPDWSWCARRSTNVELKSSRLFPRL